MTELNALRDLIEPEVKAMGFSLVRVAWVRGEGDEPTLQIMAERPETRQLVIDDCVALSHRISDKFDALAEAGDDPIDHAYRLEVSSPGIDRPLTRMQDFEDWQGHEAKIELIDTLDGQKRFRGVITGVDANKSLVMLEDRHGKCYELPYEAFESAKLVLTDRLIAETVPLDMSGADEIEDRNDIDEEV